MKVYRFYYNLILIIALLELCIDRIIFVSWDFSQLPQPHAPPLASSRGCFSEFERISRGEKGVGPRLRSNCKVLCIYSARRRYECVSTERRCDDIMFGKFIKQKFVEEQSPVMRIQPFLRSRALYNNCAKINAEEDFVK